MKGMKQKTYRFISLFLLVFCALYLIPCGISALATDSFITTVVAENMSPIAENIELSTFRNVSITGKFAAVDPEGDLVSFETATDPKKGTVELLDDGQFVYKPIEGKKGKDSFTYVAIDAIGNISETATVSITIIKQKTSITYSDMENNGANYAALTLAEEGIFTGEKLGDHYFFCPANAVSRGEFLAMCLSVCNVETLSDITRTGFSDDEEIPLWLKPYVSTALMSGAISGYRSEDGNLVFSSSAPITFAEAAVILNNVLEISDFTGVINIQQECCPTWAYQAAVNLQACDIINSFSNIYENTMTRADAAQVLLSAMEMLEDRDSDHSLLSWAR